MTGKRFDKLALLVILSLLLASCGAEATPTAQPAAPTDTPAAAPPTDTPAQAPPTETTAAAAAPTNTTAPAGGAAMGDPKAAALEAAGGKPLGGTLNLLGVWAGSE